MDELYINGKKMDMDEDSGVYLNYKSNILGDISKIESSHSYTIRLPKTAHNVSIIEAVRATRDTRFPYRKHTAMLLRDGIPIVRRANVTLRSVGSDSIDVSLSFGAGAGVKQLLSDDKNLCDMKNVVGDGRYYTQWSRHLSGDKPIADYGFRTDDLNAWYHPAISVAQVLWLIEQSYGIEIDVTNIADKIKNMVVPLLKRNGLKSEVRRLVVMGNSVSAVIEREGEEPIVFDGGFTTLTFTPNNNVDYGVEFGDAVAGGVYRLMIPKRLTTRFIWSGDVSVTYTDDADNPIDMFLAMVSTGIEGGYGEQIILSELGRVTPYDITENADGTKTARFSFLNEQSEIMRNKGVARSNSVAFCCPYGTNDRAFKVSAIIDVQNEYIVNTFDYGRAYGANVTYEYENLEGEYYYIPNLPDMKAADFVKGICQLTGAYAVVEDKTMRLISRDEVKGKVQEWRNRKVSDDGLSFSVSDIAQSNVFKYKTESGNGNFSGTIKVDDETLSWSATLVESPFTEVRIGAKNNLSFPLYKYNDEGVQEFTEDTKAYVCSALSAGKQTFLTIEGLKWSQILATNYKTYEHIIKNAKVKTARFRLSPLDLLELDMNACLYDDGAYWIIQSVKTKADNVCDVELVKILMY